MIWLIVGWVVCGVLAGMATLGFFRWEFGGTGWAERLVASYIALCGPIGALGLILGTIGEDQRGTYLYWEHGRRSRDQVYPPVQITYRFASPVSPFGSSAALMEQAAMLLGRSFEEAANPPPVEETWTPEPVLAWRWWSLDIHTLILVGAVAPWPSGTMEAEHRRSVTARPSFGSEHSKAPHPGCLCGVNALKATAVHEYLREAVGSIDVAGRVALTGVVDEYEKGYRAEKAEIIELVILADLPLLQVASEPILDALQRRYGVRPTIQPRESWLAEMEVIHGFGKEDSSDHQRAGTSGAAGGAGQGTSQAGSYVTRFYLNNTAGVCTCDMSDRSCAGCQR